MAEESSTDEESSTAEESSIVMDNGSFITKIGFGGEDAPRHMFHTVIAESLNENSSANKFIIGDQVKLSHKYHDQNMKITKPIDYKIIDSFDAMEKIWQYSFTDLMKINPSDEKTNILLTEPVLNPKANREMTTKIMFETFNFNAMYLLSSAVLSSYASGRTTSIVIDSGYNETQIVPINEGYPLPHAIKRCPFGGKDVTEYLKKLLLKDDNNTLTDDTYIEYFRELKKKNGYVARDGFDKEMEKSICNNYNYLISGYLRDIDRKYMDYTSMDIEQICDKYCGDKGEFLRERKEYKLPDGNVVTLSENRFKCTECFFDPSLIGLELEGLHKMVLQQILVCDVDIKNELPMNIVLSGGNTLFDGLEQRLQNELVRIREDLRWNCSKTRVIAPKDRGYSAWIGGSILASLSTFESMWISRNEYDESGQSIVHRRCFT